MTAAPMSSFVGAALALSACASVLTTMNSTPSRPKLIIVLTALPPEPPQPITLMRAWYSCCLVGKLDRETHVPRVLPGIHCECDEFRELAELARSRAPLPRQVPIVRIVVTELLSRCYDSLELRKLP